jgi:hypothetical protein
MTNRPGNVSVLWSLAGLALLAALILVLWQFRQDPARQLAFKATRVDLVGRMQLGLASASEAEKSAVLATTDEDSQRFSGQARAANAEVERERQELGQLLASGGTPREKELLARFSEAFAALQGIDEEVLRLAVKNSNVKAYGLLFGPVAETVAEMDAALSRLVARNADAADARRVTLLASGARIGVLRIQALLAPHIAEAGDARMDLLETSMAKEEVQVRKDLDGLAALPRIAGDADLAIAASSFVRFGELKGRILALSRENTNVQSLALSLNQKRNAMLLCLDALTALQQAILEEPIPGVSYGRGPTR